MSVPVAQAGLDEAADAAVKALRSGGLAILPTETVYGLAAPAREAKALARLAELAKAVGVERPGVSTWHAPTRRVVAEALQVTAPLHVRMLRRLAPGPVRFLVPRGERAAEICEDLGVGRGVLERDGEFAVRVPDHPIALDVLSRATGPVVAERSAAFGFGDGGTLGTEAVERARAAEIAAVDAGPTRYGKGSTTVRLKADGGYEVVSVGVWDERLIRRRIERVVLLVCTGNTCRSPMAEAIARDVLGKKHATIPTRVMSAGVAAGEGGPMTAEARQALTEMGVDPGRHRSHGVTAEEVRDADVVFAMTRSHLRSLLDIQPEAAGKVFVLDPGGQDVPDPIGGPLEDYRRTAARLRTLVEARLAELEKRPEGIDE